MIKTKHAFSDIGTKNNSASNSAVVVEYYDYICLFATFEKIHTSTGAESLCVKERMNMHQFFSAYSQLMDAKHRLEVAMQYGSQNRLVKVLLLLLFDGMPLFSRRARGTSEVHLARRQGRRLQRCRPAVCPTCCTRHSWQLSSHCVRRR